MPSSDVKACLDKTSSVDLWAIAEAFNRIRTLWDYRECYGSLRAFFHSFIISYTIPVEKIGKSLLQGSGRAPVGILAKLLLDWYTCPLYNTNGACPVVWRVQLFEFSQTAGKL